MLYPLVESCLPDEIIRTWERNKGYKTHSLQDGSNSENHQNRLSLLMNFLREEVEGEERVKMARTGFDLEIDQRKRISRRILENTEEQFEIPTAAGLFSSPKTANEQTFYCIFCHKGHASVECRQAKNMTLDDKLRIVRKTGGCFRCLKKGHLSKMCHGKQICPHCKKRHFAVMCPHESVYKKLVTSKPEENLDPEVANDSVLTNQSCTSSVQLQTLKVYLRGENGRHIFRVLIDTGSQKSYISAYAANLMNYEILGEQEIVHHLFGGVESTPQKHRRHRIYLTSLDEKYKCNFEALTQDKICGHIREIENGDIIEELRQSGIKLTDTHYTSIPLEGKIETDIHVLIGADIAGKLLTGRIHELPCGLVAVETRLGWTLIGKVQEKQNSPDTTMSVLSMFVKDENIAELWRLDRIGITDPSETQSKEEIQRSVQEHFRKSLKVNSEGRYEISLPWLEMQPTIEDGYELAKRRLFSTVKKLQTANILKEYQEVFRSWLSEGIIEEITDQKDNCPKHYLPHRAVIKELSTTKIRPVFDASAHQKNYPSLNSFMEKGPNLLELIPALLTRFRMRKFGVISDIRQAFLQISVKQSDRDFLRFLWHEDGDPEREKIYRHRRVVFGLVSSPFLLSATIAYHLENVSSEFQKTANLLLESFYVDNCVTSLDDYLELNKFIVEAKEIMLSAKFDLRGWCYNNNRVTDFTQSEKKSIWSAWNSDPLNKLSQNISEIVSVLGMMWDPNIDVLFCDVNKVNLLEDSPITKRNILATAQKLFDPLGILCPVTLLPKLVLQECWKLKVSWDQPLSKTISDKFSVWKRQLLKLEDLKVPRWMVGECFSLNDISLHVFADASKCAYATCIFVRVENQDVVSCQLVRAKARVAPLKSTTIPRLELLACCIAARLADNVKRDMRCPDMKTFYWSDSSNALHWIKGNDQWATFVANRVQEIRQLSRHEEWHHIPGRENPADIPSRGCSVSRLIAMKWWEGPEWLRGPQKDWPVSDVTPDKEIIDLEKRKSVVSSMVSTVRTNCYYNNISSFIKLVRVTAWLFRFSRNTRVERSKRSSADLTVNELRAAELVLLKLAQRDDFTGVKDERLFNLQPYLDTRGLLRTKTRILMRTDEENFRCPIILPSDHSIVTKLIMCKHIQLSHCGIQTLMTHLREHYWILKSRKTIRKVINQCVRCKRFTVRHMEVQTAPLPEDRVRDARVFEITGIDLAGPLFLRHAQKAWIVLFTCAVYRAIHLELVTTLSTESFLLALRRFIARRGRPEIIYSDNGTNFVGANSALKKINWKSLLSETTVSNICWKFIPPSAPWWGGWWERLVSMVKQILKKVLGRASLQYEEMNTVICDCESVINARPLTYISEDSQELQPLTPSMFLQEIEETGVPDLDILESTNKPKRYLYRKKLREDFRKRFRVEYLGQLKHVQKVKHLSKPPRVGEIVLIGSENCKRLQWPLAKVLELYPGKDGLVRVVKLRSKNGEFLRPVQRLYPLELDEELQSSYRESEILRKPKKCNIPEKMLAKNDAINNRTRSGRQVTKPERLIQKM